MRINAEVIVPGAKISSHFHKVPLTVGAAAFGALIPAHLFLHRQLSGVRGRGPISRADLGGGTRSEFSGL